MNKVNTMIKLLRTEKGINQEQLAEHLHVTRQAVSSWETGKTQPDIETLTKMAEYFGVSVEQMIYGKEYSKETGEIKKTWTWEKFRLSFTWYPERFMMLGAALAMVISYVNWHSVGWAVVHGLLNWAYVVYFLIFHG